MKSRIASILNSNQLDSSVTGLPTFNLSDLIFNSDLDFQLPTKLRLGHLAERVVSELIKLSTNYTLLYENVQLIDDKKTIGELDFILQEENTRKVIHMELAYKFYLYDPSISSEPINNWIGPNRNDSLKEKLNKIKSHQFPLFRHPSAQTFLGGIDLNEIDQALCLLVSLFVPYEYEAKFNPIYERAIKGYYIGVEKFVALDHSKTSFYLPPKKEWGIDPSENDTWADYNAVEKQIHKCIEERQAPLCWQKKGHVYFQYFIVWW